VKGRGCDCLGLIRGLWRELVGDEPEASRSRWHAGGGAVWLTAFRSINSSCSGPRGTSPTSALTLWPASL